MFSELQRSTSISNFKVSIVKSDKKMFLYVDSKNATEAAVPKIKPINKIFIGGVPPDGSDCLENSVNSEFYLCRS